MSRQYLLNCLRTANTNLVFTFAEHGANMGAASSDQLMDSYCKY